MMPAQAAWFLLARIGATALLGAVLGAVLGSLLGGIALALAAMLAWQLATLFRFAWWLRDRSNRTPPDVSGVWGTVISTVVRLHRRKRYHKQRLLDLFRELRRSTAAMPDGVVILNSHWEIAWFNRTASRLLGLRRKIDLGIRLTNLIRDPALGRYLEQGLFNDPLIVARGGDNRLHLSFQVVPYGGAQRLMLVRDVSRQMALESMRKDFVANASHELRSPLTVVTGYLETLASDDRLDESLRAPVAEMQRQTQRMNGIVSDLLDLSRLDAVDREVEGRQIDVPAMCSVLRKDVLARPAHPEVQLDVATDAHLLGDESEILSAFSNLVDNAAKYTPPSGRIRLVWRLEEDGSARFVVEDTGPGIAPEHLPRLTERFYRVDEGRSRAAGGSGLGLAIVKHVLQHHGATLDVTSEPDVGSSFACVFPPRRVIGSARSVNIPTTQAALAGR
ncbi:MAG TPA: phosphate regulon sensor histidine kinase PhoR [Steroidobacteraceae bacterium]|nr:phosphate regulon sensor histidine kinase PhoR [Steroidobacteraceae bacterium]